MAHTKCVTDNISSFSGWSIVALFCRKPTTGDRQESQTGECQGRLKYHDFY